MPGHCRSVSSPISHSTPSSSSSSRVTRSAAGRRPRRSTGSETNTRRVLADLDWWRVEEHQSQVRGHELRLARPTEFATELDQEEREPERERESRNQQGVSPFWHLQDVGTSPGSGFGGVDAFNGPSPFNLDLSLTESLPEPSSSHFAQYTSLSLGGRSRPLQRSMSTSSTYSTSSDASDASFDSIFDSPAPRSIGLNLGLSDCVSVPTSDDDDECDPFAVPLAPASFSSPFGGFDSLDFTNSPRRSSAMSTPAGRSVSYSCAELEESRQRREREFDESLPSFFSNTSGGQDDFFF